MSSDWTGIAELDDVLRELRDTARRILAGGLVGVYLHGSFALGGADDESDCDFLVATSTELDADQLQALRRFHADLPHRSGYWNTHLEGAYAPVADLADLGALDRAWPYVDHGGDEVRLDRHCNTEVLRWTLYERPTVVDGSDSRTLVKRVPAAIMRAAAGRNLSEAINAWARHDLWDAWSQRYAVVSLPRMLRTLIEGDVVSKPAAVAWAMEVLEPRWHPLMTTALAQRGQRPWDAPVDVDLVRRTLDFVHHVGTVAEGHQPVHDDSSVPGPEDELPPPDGGASPRPAN